MGVVTSAGGRLHRSGWGGWHPLSRRGILSAAGHCRLPTRCACRRPPLMKRHWSRAQPRSASAFWRGHSKRSAGRQHMLLMALALCGMSAVMLWTAHCLMHDSADTTEQTSHRLVRACCLLQHRWSAGSEITCCSAGGHRGAGGAADSGGHCSSGVQQRPQANEHHRPHAQWQVGLVCRVLERSGGACCWGVLDSCRLLRMPCSRWAKALQPQCCSERATTAAPVSWGPSACSQPPACLKHHDALQGALQLQHLSARCLCLIRGACRSQRAHALPQGAAAQTCSS